ncbi:hypothetical protein B0T21DRAFT_390277 [Apiosordaria backusii]|uniref:Uncharacterized protein n=1 Tax=Apiosordaria backusii TaxID=314023 RepID=A0AA40K414_9PEZI|nr:hypothetical protein B0T21DRAFT_390277 [Apiosordaria backusii]
MTCLSTISLIIGLHWNYRIAMTDHRVAPITHLSRTLTQVSIDPIGLSSSANSDDISTPCPPAHLHHWPGSLYAMIIPYWNYCDGRKRGPSYSLGYHYHRFPPSIGQSDWPQRLDGLGRQHFDNVSASQLFIISQDRGLSLRGSANMGDDLDDMSASPLSSSAKFLLEVYPSVDSISLSGSAA